MSDRIYSYCDLIVYQKTFSAGERSFELSKEVPQEEMYSLTDQVRRSSRRVSANLAEIWRKRRYEKFFCSTLNIANAEADETQVWIDDAAAHGDPDASTLKKACEYYDEILRTIVQMIASPKTWCIRKSPRDEDAESRRQGVQGSFDRHEAEEAPIINQPELLL
ncbi:four helix bundle protein [Allorhodopirellula heiligendammensis]|uniref:Four helix bundle protein n=1 Tax=Allorhodopirellula heiligendammensis TaxID=2714739 RepID=A0A5C6BUM2_9BACT|nr:four helix bundle protein [Allorhodopirellula heiligendammensis]TWU15141.1 hypothetical protein Poly21_23330 [Allorhodopirellula heiligendammensis]